MTTGLQVVKTLFKYNSNSLEENDEEENEWLILSLLIKKTDPYNDELAIDFKWSGIKEEEEDIVMTKINESL